MSALDAGQLNRLLRDLEFTASVAMRKAAPKAVQHQWLQAAVHRVDVSQDEDFQQRLARYVGLRGKLRANKQALFSVLEELKSVSPLAFEDILRRVSDLTGQLEKSVASALLGLLDPSQAAIDRDLRELLPRYGFPLLAEAPSFDECVRWHADLGLLFEQVIASPRWQAIVSRLDSVLPVSAGTDLSDVCKLGLHLSQARRVVALTPAPTRFAAPVARPATQLALSAAQSGEGVSRPGAVRLHLCR
jgi:hypothetical protein